MLADLELRASFFIPGFSAERHPGTVAAIVEAGHEIGHHGYLHRPPGLIDAATERSELELGLAALERIAGVRATIFRAPWWETSTATFDLLLEYGFTCDSSLFDRDVPYRLGIGSSELVEVPVSWALDDWEKYAFLPDPPTGSGVIESPGRVHEMWWGEIQAYVEVGGCCVLTMHPFLSGRPSRVRALRGLLEKAATVSDLWIATVGEVAAQCAGSEVPVHPLTLPTIGPGPAEPVPGS
jgi:peptidoglycan-N-acetylglucosamine deacetylase